MEHPFSIPHGSLSSSCLTVFTYIILEWSVQSSAVLHFSVNTPLLDMFHTKSIFFTVDDPKNTTVIDDKNATLFEIYTKGAGETTISAEGEDIGHISSHGGIIIRGKKVQMIKTGVLST